ncbi:MAG TPA: hypothetical protein VNI02_16760 [Blastocatellia bacterium]|jgi:hypothetical protein|nr:hypothetical protein [Blastocatellia bacterium]
MSSEAPVGGAGDVNAAPPQQESDVKATAVVEQPSQDDATVTTESYLPSMRRAES